MKPTASDEHIERRDDEVVIRGDDLQELEGYLRYSMGRGLFLIPTRVTIGNTRPRDITDETEDGEPTLLFENTRIMEADIEIEDGGELVLRLPDRDELYERFKEEYDGGHDFSESGGGEDG